MTDVVASLPDRPLKPSELDALTETDVFEDATPLTWTGPLVEVEPERRLKQDVLQVALTRPDDTTFVCSFDPEAEQWRLTQQATLGGDDDTERDLLVRALGLGAHGEWLREHYGDRLDGLADDARGWDDDS